MSSAPLAVVVVQGGPSAEAEVSRSSAAAVAAALTESGHQVRREELDAELALRLSRVRPDAVFPVTHGPLGEDGCLQGLLEIMGLPYVGSGVLASALAADKSHAKAEFKTLGLPLAGDELVVRSAELSLRAAELRRRLGPALVAKPAGGGSAIGVTRIKPDDPDSALVAALEQALELGDQVLVEEFKAGLEVTCGVLEDAAGVAFALPPTLIKSQAADWYDFTSRYATGGSAHECPAPFEPSLIQRIQEVALAAHRCLGCRDLSRVDFVVNPDTPEVTLLEVNTLPGMTATSLFPEAAAASGVPFRALCDRLVRRAQQRPPRRIPAALQLPP